MAAQHDFEKITIVSINGVLGRARAALNALVHSNSKLPGSRALLISPSLPQGAPAFVRHVPITEIGYLDYTVFVLYCLRAFIETEFALIVQDDGWVLSAENWRPYFLEYDFVGAPVHLAQVHAPDGLRMMNGFEWVNVPAEWRVDHVLNGGFSLRSRKALHAPAALKLNLVVPPVAELAGPPYSMQFRNQQTLEDVQFCVHMRPALEKEGMRYAPLHVAKEFSFEHLGPRIHTGVDLGTVFGQHSKLRKICSIDPLRVSYSVTAQEAQKIYGESRIIKLFEKLGYAVSYSAS